MHLLDPGPRQGQRSSSGSPTTARSWPGRRAGWWRLPRQDVVISLTTPPFVVLGAVAHRLVHRRARVVLWSMDCYPDVIERLGSRTRAAPPAVAPSARRRPPTRGPTVAGGSAPGGVLRPVALAAPGRADVPGAAGGQPVGVPPPRPRRRPRRADAASCCSTGTAPAGRARLPPSTVIPNWEAAADFPRRRRPSSRGTATHEPDLAGRFVVLYLGNLGFGHRVETVVAAAAAIARRRAACAWLFMGGGARWEQLAELAATGRRRRPRSCGAPTCAKEVRPR